MNRSPRPDSKAPETNTSADAGGSYIATGVFGLAVTGLAWIEAGSFPLQRLESGLGAAFFPWLVLGIIVLLSMCSLVYGTLQGVRFKLPFIADRALAKAALVFVALCAFCVTFARFGLLIPVILFLVLSMRFLGAPWWRAGGIGAAAGLAIHLLFVEGLGIVMP